MRALALGLLMALVAGSAGALPAFSVARAQWVSSEAWLLDRDGIPLHELRLDKKSRRLAWMPLAEISPALKEAVIASEDRHFFAHGGVDWTALGAAALQSVTSSKSRGASTISMQLAALLEPEQLGRGGTRSLRQKWDQLLAARELESAWTKEEILEAYLNLSAFRGELVGIEAAAQGLFGKSAVALDRAESMLLAVLLRGPNAAAPFVARRACSLRDMLPRAPDCAELQRLAARLPAPSALGNAGPQWAPHLAHRLLKLPGSRVRSTLRFDLQSFAVKALERRLRDLSGQNVNDGAAIVIDNLSGEVLAYVGSSGALSDASAVDGIQAPRLAGSTLKPFLYGLALEQGWLTAASLIDDSPVDLVLPSGDYLPQNYDHQFRGWVSVRTALAGSLNIPAVRTLVMTGPDLFHERLRALGFDTLDRDAEHYGYALALGGAEVTLQSLTNAYRVLANQGLYSPPSVLPGTGAGATRLMPAGAAFIVSDILADNSARAGTFGLASPLATRVWSAVKTGTSKDMRDNWCVGFSSRYTVGVWVGNFSGLPMHDVSGVSGAAPVWRDLIDFLHRQEPSTAPAPEVALDAAPVRFADDIEAEREEWFLPGTAVARVEPAGNAESRPRIVYPPEGLVLALDPDIPPDRQRVAFLARPARADLRWKLDGTLVGEGARALWPPRPGRHRLRLEWGDAEDAQALEFVVKGSAAPRVK